MVRAARVLVVGIVMLTFGAMPLATDCCATRCAAAMSGCHRSMGAVPCPHCRAAFATMDPTLSPRDSAASVRTLFGLPSASPARDRHPTQARALAPDTGPPVFFPRPLSSPLRI